MIAGGPEASEDSRDGEQDVFFFNDGTAPRKANQRIDAELTVLGLPPLGPRPRYSIEAKLGLLRSRLYKKLRQQFPAVWFYIEYRNGIGAGPYWSGTHEVQVVWIDGPSEETVETTVRGLVKGMAVDLSLDRKSPNSLINDH